MKAGIMQTTLVILAAGMGNRYGGLKQIQPVDDEGHLLIDFSIYDALMVGFTDIVCIIKEELRETFDAALLSRIDVPVRYAFQCMDECAPVGRVKPLGTTHALLSCKDIVKNPFAVINADDYYSRDALKTMQDFLCSSRAPGEYAMVGYKLENALPAKGEVTRGIAQTDETGYLRSVNECKHVFMSEDGPAVIKCGEVVSLSPNSPTSMNLWGFGEEVMEALSMHYKIFCETDLIDNPMNAECILPTSVQFMLENDRAKVRVLDCDAKWFGVTHKSDHEGVARSIQELKRNGIYPNKLWK